MPFTSLSGQCKHCGCLFKKESTWSFILNKLDVMDYIGEVTAHVLNNHPEQNPQEVIADLQKLEEQLTNQL